MYHKYRVILTTISGRYLAATSDSVNGLADIVYYWFLNTPQGRSIYDDQVRNVALYEYNLASAQYVNVGQLPADSRKQAISQVRVLGAR